MTGIVPLSNATTMSSREIAELTGKRHDHVLRDIDNLLKTLPPDLGTGFSMTYEGDPSNGYRLYLMDRDSSYCLVSGYDATARMRIIKRWQELEAHPLIKRTDHHEQKPISQHAETRVALDLFSMGAKAARSAGFKGNMIALSANNLVRSTTGFDVLARMGATHLIADPRGKTYTPSELGKMCDPPLSAVKLNLLLESAGLQTKEFGAWLPTDAATGLFEWLDTGKKHSNGTPVKQIKWFSAALNRIGALEAA